MGDGISNIFRPFLRKSTLHSVSYSPKSKTKKSHQKTKSGKIKDLTHKSIKSLEK